MEYCLLYFYLLSRGFVLYGNNIDKRWLVLYEALFRSKRKEHFNDCRTASNTCQCSHNCYGRAKCEQCIVVQLAEFVLRFGCHLLLRGFVSNYMANKTSNIGFLKRRQTYPVS